MRKITLVAMAAAALLAGTTSCKKEELKTQVSGTVISKISTEKIQDVPFEDIAALEAFKGDPQVIDYSTARKIAWIELVATELDKEMKWEGNKLSKSPVVIYGFDNKPKYYDYMVLDAEENILGVLTVHARKAASTSIKALSSKVKNYNALLSKSVGNASLFADWADNSYVGLRGKSGDSPSDIINAETGEVADGVKEIEGVEIIEEMKESVLPALLNSENDVLPSENLLADDKYAELLKAIKSQSVDAVVDSMLAALLKNTNDTEEYWNFIATLLSEIEALNDEEIVEDLGKGLFSRIVSAVRRVVSKVDERKYVLDRYVNSGAYRSGISDWCGPWVCGYIMFVKTKQDKYNQFESCASSVGRFGVANFSLRLLGRPMTPVEMAWSMPIISGGKIWIDPDLRFVDYAAYDQIRYKNKPAIRLCSTGGSLHWTLAYGAYQTGNYVWRNYYYLQQDNGALFSEGAYKNPQANFNYSQVDWWNPWMLVHD